MHLILIFLIAFSLHVFAFAGGLPDPVRTPGALNPAVTQDNIASTICAKGWTHSARPASSYTNELKRRQIDEYGYSDKTLSRYEEDHLISLELGGHPTDPRNLWPQPYVSEWGATKKDRLETALRQKVCKGEMLLADAQRLVGTDWVAAWNTLFAPGSK